MGRKSVVKHYSRVIEYPDGKKQIEDEKITVEHKKGEEPFGVIFFRYIGWIYGITNPTALKLLFMFSEMAEFNTGRFKLNSFDKSEIINRLEISRVTFYSALNILIENNAVKKDIRIDKETGEQISIKDYYMINPEMFWRGDLKKRKEFKVTFESCIDDLDEKKKGGNIINKDFEETVYEK